MIKHNSALFFTCSLIEFLGRTTMNTSLDILKYLGKEDVARIYSHADVFHCEPIAKVADDFIQKDHIPQGNYDNLSRCNYTIPDIWDIGEVFERLIVDCVSEHGIIETMYDVYQSWIADAILNFNSDFYYQSRDYIALCYVEGEVLAE